MADQFRIAGIDAIKSAMDKYSSSSADFFSLKDDGDIAKVRFAHGDDKDLDVYVVHKVKMAGKDKYIACLSPTNQACPLCQAGHRPTVRLFLTLMDTRDNKMKLWDRGKTEIPNILALITRYGRLDGRYYEIQRHGKKGSTDTSYQFFPLDPIPNPEPLKREPIIGETGFILQKTADEMRSLLNEIDLDGSVTQYGSRSQSGTGRMF